MVALGMTPTEALLTATINAAAICDIADLCGRIAPGLAADLVVTRANPLADISAVRQIDRVIVKRETIVAPIT